MAPFYDDELIAIAAERLSDTSGVGFVDRRGAAEVPFAFMAHPAGQVAGPALSMPGLFLGCQAKPLLGPFMRLLLGHGSLLTF